MAADCTINIGIQERESIMVKNKGKKVGTKNDHSVQGSPQVLGAVESLIPVHGRRQKADRLLPTESQAERREIQEYDVSTPLWA